MSRSADAQNRTAEPDPKPSNGTWPMARFLDAAIVTYLTTLAVFVVLAALGIHVEASQRAATVLLMVATVIPGVIFVIFYVVFLVSSLAGVPLIHFSNGLSTMQRNWKVTVGTVLLLAVLLAVIAAIM